MLVFETGEDILPSLKGFEWTFDTEASRYEKMRPGYVNALYKEIFAYIPIDENSQVLEIGSGGGQATEPLLKTGCRLTAVEYGKNFSNLLLNKFGHYPGFDVVTSKFEEAVLEKDAYDFIYSASAFHWIPEAVGYKKVYELLKNGGVFARFANHPYRDKYNPELSDAIDLLYNEYYCRYHKTTRKVLKEYSASDAEERALIARKYGFTDIKYSLFTRERIFSGKEYTELLGTYSDHIAIEEPIRKEFFKKIEMAIDDHGGTITIFDTIDLQLARKVL